MRQKNSFFIRMVTLFGVVLLFACCQRQQYLHKVNLLDKGGYKSGAWIELEGIPSEEQIIVFCHYKRGIRNGEYRSYYLDGPVHAKGQYMNGNRVGKWIGYLEDGTVSWWQLLDKNGELLHTYGLNLEW